MVFPITFCAYQFSSKIGSESTLTSVTSNKKAGAGRRFKSVLFFMSSENLISAIPPDETLYSLISKASSGS